MVNFKTDQENEDYANAIDDCIKRCSSKYEKSNDLSSILYFLLIKNIIPKLLILNTKLQIEEQTICLWTSGFLLLKFWSDSFAWIS